MGCFLADVSSYWLHADYNKAAPVVLHVYIMGLWQRSPYVGIAWNIMAAPMNVLTSVYMAILLSLGKT